MLCLSVCSRIWLLDISKLALADTECLCSVVFRFVRMLMWNMLIRSRLFLYDLGKKINATDLQLHMLIILSTSRLKHFQFESKTHSLVCHTTWMSEERKHMFFVIHNSVKESGPTSIGKWDMLWWSGSLMLQPGVPGGAFPTEEVVQSPLQHLLGFTRPSSSQPLPLLC